jgi:hypothetical protein
VKAKAYLETSFVSYLVARLSPDLTTLQRQLSSQRWWEMKRTEFDLVVSELVHDECGQGNQAAAESRSAILAQTAFSNRTMSLEKERSSAARLPFWIWEK